MDMLTRDEFIGLDPSLSLLLANGLVEKTKDPPGEAGLLLPSWRYRINPTDELVEVDYKDAEEAAYARLDIPEGDK